MEAVIDYGGGQVFDVVLISELRDGKMWRAQWVERMEPRFRITYFSRSSR